MRIRTFILTAALAALASSAGFNTIWGYTESNVEPYGPSYWHLAYPMAGGNKQSPINIVTSSVVKNNDLQALKLDYHSDSVTIVNNGATVDIDIETPSENTLTDAYGKIYYLNGIHFHWSNVNNSLGSEHTVDGVSGVVECHLVHFSANYSSLSAAVSANVSGALSVIGLFFDIGSENSGLSPLSSIFDQITEPNTSNIISSTFNPSDLLPSSETDSVENYWHYSGSLTAPGCFEIVNWYVVKDRLQLSEAQLIDFRALLHDEQEQITHNNRPVQPLNSRSVYTRSVSKSAGSHFIPSVLAVLAFLATRLMF